MPVRIEEKEGQVYGNWTILHYIEPKDRLPENKDLSYLAKCSCGTIRPIRITDLRKGKSKSCGCLSKKAWNNELGKTYGDLTVLKQLNNRFGNPIQQYECRCSCGKEVIIPSDLIGKKKNCGCKFMEGFDTRQNLVGQKFGRLTVIEMSERLDHDGKRSYVICKCDCGNVCEVYRGHLKGGHTSSCGCLVSYGEEYVGSFLQKTGVDFKRQYQFSNLIDKKPLKFDIAILSFNNAIGLIEVQGKQHYDDSLLFSSDTLLEHDKMKKEYCKNNKIPFLILNYYEGKEKTNFSKWDKLLKRFLEQIGVVKK